MGGLVLLQHHRPDHSGVRRLTPSTTGSKLFTVFYVISGIALITTYLNQLGKRFALLELAKHKAASDGDT